MSFKYSSINFEIAFSKSLFFFRHLSVIARSGSRAAATSKMERFVIIVITKRSILDVAAGLDPPLIAFRKYLKRCISQQGFRKLNLINRRLGWRSFTNDGAKYQMRGNMFVINQMRIIFLTCYCFSIFQVTLRMSFKKIDLWPRSYIMFRRILALNILIER